MSSFFPLEIGYHQLHPASRARVRGGCSKTCLLCKTVVDVAFKKKMNKVFGHVEVNNLVSLT